MYNLPSLPWARLFAVSDDQGCEPLDRWNIGGSEDEIIFLPLDASAADRSMRVRALHS